MLMLMKTTACLFVAAGVLMACSTPPPAGMPATPMERVLYSCGGSESVEVRFFPEQGVAVLVRHGHTHELQQEPAASGFRYTNGAYTVLGKADEMRLEVGRMAPITCQKKTTP